MNTSPWGTNDPTKGDRVVETDPWDTKASEFTWQNDGTTSYTVTRGNNGIAQANYEGDNAYLNDYRPDAPDVDFDYDFQLTWTNFKTYSNSSVAQLWYTANMYHDLLYDLGFTEAAGNFETNNNGQGGMFPFCICALKALGPDLHGGVSKACLLASYL